MPKIKEHVMYVDMIGFAKDVVSSNLNSGDYLKCGLSFAFAMFVQIIIIFHLFVLSERLPLLGFKENLSTVERGNSEHFLKLKFCEDGLICKPAICGNLLMAISIIE